MRADVDDLIIDWYSLHEDDTDDPTNTSLSPCCAPSYAHHQVYGDCEELNAESRLWPPAPFDFYTEKNRDIKAVPVNSKTDALAETLSLQSESDGLVSIDGETAGQGLAEPFMSLKKRFCGNKGNRLICELIEIANKFSLDACSTNSNRVIMKREMGGLLDFSRRRNMRIKVCSQFNLYDHLQAQKLGIKQAKAMKQMEEDNCAELAYSYLDRARATRRYIDKRNKRRSNKFIRYDVRRKLANNRLRAKGKFLKKAKVDIMEVAKELKAHQANF